MLRMELLDRDYWELVEADPRDWSDDQKILFWWVVGLLSKVSPHGVIMAPAQAPLTDTEIVEALEAVLPQDGRQRSYLDKIWSYEDQRIVFPSSEGSLVMIKHGEVVIEKDPFADKRERL